MVKINSPSQLEFHFDPIVLPEVRISKKLPGIGKIEHLVKEMQTVIPLSKMDITVSSRRREKIYRLPSKDGIIITSKKTHPPYREADAILSIGYESPKWLFHRKQQEIETLLTSESRSKLRNFIRDSWLLQFMYKKETENSKGLRLPQIGALHAIASHWTLSNEPANVVMPTGTGKTEIMLSVLISERCECLLVIVPTKALREQTAQKFINLGVLRETGNIGSKGSYPVVGILEHRPKSIEDLDIFDRCNVVVAVINTIAQGTADKFISKVAEKCSHLIIDEAHHVAAQSWTKLRDNFRGKLILQFTATPYREDRSPIQGSIIYNYPLGRAQEDGLFRLINFRGVFKTDQVEADKAIARIALDQLNSDLEENYDHIIMARCQNKRRAKNIFKLYKRLARDFNPVLIFSGQKEIDNKIRSLREGKSRIVVCVNMLAEGFDLPELKIAAMHDKFKSLAITLQFTGRFTRTSLKKIGDATIIANTGIEDVSDSLQSLYDEDPDWDKLIARLSFDKIEEEDQLLKFLQKADKIPIEVADDFSSVTPQSLMPRFNTVVYECKRYHPHNFFKGIGKNQELKGGWINKDPKVIFFVTYSAENLLWCRNRKIKDSFWNIFAAYYNDDQGLLYIHSSFKSNNLHADLAAAVSNGTARKIKGEQVFRVFGQINRLILQQVGLLQVGPRNLRYSMFMGRDVKQAITDVVSGQSKKSNIFGTGFADGKPVGVGCSKKGKIWGRGEQGPLLSWTKWCDRIGEKLIDDSISVEDLISNVLVPVEIDILPETPILFIDWPDKLYQKPEEKITLLNGTERYFFHTAEIVYVETNKDQKSLRFLVRCEEQEGTYLLKIGREFDYGYSIIYETGTRFDLEIWSVQWALDEYFRDYPPTIFFIDQSELQGNLYTQAREPSREFPSDQIVSFNWEEEGVNIIHESRWRKGEIRGDSIQEWVMSRCRDENFNIVFDDDGSNEIADVVCIREDDSQITIRMVHCKFSLKSQASGRIKDAVEVASQATKNVRWFWNFNRLLTSLARREQTRKPGRPSRFFTGNKRTLKYFKRLQKIKGFINAEVIIAQPGISAKKITPNILSVLGAADAYIKTTIETPLILWCNQ